MTRVDLERFVRAQAGDDPRTDVPYADALAELRAGRKRSHWIWYVFPQLRGLGHSELARHFGLDGRAGADAYAAHPVLGARLVEAVRAVTAHAATPIAAVMGSQVDALKLRSCLTLFEAVWPSEPVFAAALDTCFGGVRDERTVALLAASTGQSPTAG